MTWICIGQGGTMLLGVILLKLLTTMGLQEYGKYALVLSASALLSSIFYGPLDQGFVRYYCDYANKGMTRYFMQLFYKSMLFPASLLFIITLSAVAAVLMFGDNKRIFFMMGGGLFIIVSATTNPFNSLLNVYEREGKMQSCKSSKR